MFTTTGIKLAIIAAIMVAISGLGYWGYSSVKQKGYSEGYTKAETTYITVIKQYQQDIANKVAVLEENSSTLIALQQVNDAKLLNNISKIITNSKGKPLVIYKNGVCQPNQVFVETLNNINKQVNKGIR